MKGDKILKVYGNNTFMYEIDKGWVVPEFPPEIEFPPDPIDPPPLTDFVYSDEVFLGGIDEGSNAAGLNSEGSTYSTGWLEVRPNYIYTVFIPESNRFRIQYNETLNFNNTIKYNNTYSKPNTSAQNQFFITGAKTKYVRINAWTYPVFPFRAGNYYITLNGQENI